MRADLFYLISSSQNFPPKDFFFSVSQCQAMLTYHADSVLAQSGVDHDTRDVAERRGDLRHSNDTATNHECSTRTKVLSDSHTKYPYFSCHEGPDYFSFVLSEGKRRDMVTLKVGNIPHLVESSFYVQGLSS
jgi:hypothetical protein